MKKTIYLLVSVLIVSIIAFSGPYNIAESANTYSTDFEAGSSQYLSVSDGSQTGLDISTTATFEAWVKPESQPDNDSNLIILSKHNNGSDEGYEFAYRNESGTYKLFLRISEASDGSDMDAFKVTQTLNNDTWYHLAATWDGATKTAKFYVNGTQVGGDQVGTNVSTHRNSGATFGIGGSFNSGSPAYFWDGLIDEVRVWSIVRTSTEIADDRNRELFGNETGLMGYWKLNNSLSDATANANNLSNNNSATFTATTPFVGFSESLKVRKASNESVANSVTLQSDDQLKLSLDVNKTYIVDGVIFASSTSATPDIIIGFFGQSDSIVTIGYTNDVNEMVLESGATSTRIALPANTPTSIHVKGTVKTSGTSGDFQLKWSQATSNSASTTVMEGSYLKAESI